jgi:hypothetical protein
MTVLPRRLRTTTATPASRGRVATALRAFWHAMRVAHHERIPF